MRLSITAAIVSFLLIGCGSTTNHCVAPERPPAALMAPLEELTPIDPGSPVSDKVALISITENNGKCLKIREKLRSLQKWEEERFK